MKTLKRVAIVVGESSGDILGAGLISALKKHFPDCQFEGIGGPQMLAHGFVSHFPMERLAVMGLVEPLKRLPELLGIRKSLKLRYKQNPPDLFIGIDAPDFNLNLEAAIRKNGTITVHYVSPSVWAWRQGRVKKIARAVDMILTLFPFEAKFYDEHKVPVHCVGHPLADKLPIEDASTSARKKLGLDSDGLYLAVLPGSRRAEVENLAATFIQAAAICKKTLPHLRLLIPAVNELRQEEIQAILDELNFAGIPQEDIRLSQGDSHDVMAAADVVLMASGTTTLEAMLLKRPMVIAYCVAPLSYWILKCLVKSKYIGLPNLLANEGLVPELIQGAASPENISEALMEYFQSKEKREAVLSRFRDIHLDLKKNANEEAAKALIELCNQTLSNQKQNEQ
ncbi:MAG: lipid-A-disaccharide synthase [Agarilytica sp.]